MLENVFISQQEHQLQEHQSVNNIFSNFLSLNFFRMISIIRGHNNKNSNFKNCCPNLGSNHGPPTQA